MTHSTPALYGPKTRVYRTVFQVALAVLVATPAAVALLPISAATAASAIGIAGALTVIVSAVQNALNARGI